MIPSKFFVSLRFKLFNNVVELSEICNELGLEPGRKWFIGEPRTTPKGDPLPGVYDCSYCYFKFPHQENEQLHETLDRICDTMEPHLNLFRRIRNAGGKIECFVMWVSIGDTGETFSNELLCKMSTLGIDLGINVLGETAPPDIDPEGQVET